MYYKIPFDFGSVMEGSSVATCDLPESIAQHIQLIITTRQAENRFDADYGNPVWDIDFENSISDARWQEQLRVLILDKLQKYEKRIFNISVAVHSEWVEKTWPLKKFTEIKKKVTVLVNSQLVDTEEKFTFKTEIYISPMAVE
jgi:phage baseplate assembly protein W